MARPAAAATMVDTGESRIIMPYAPTPSEMKRRWTQTADGIYASPQLAVDESENRIVKIDWFGSLGAAGLASERTGRTYFVASYGEELDAIKRNKQAEQEATDFAAWTRNRCETIKTEDGREFTRIYAFGPGIFTDLLIVLKDGYIASINPIGAPDAVSQTNPDFPSARLYYGNNHVVRGWSGGCYANANYGALNAKSPKKRRERELGLPQ